MSDQKQVDPSLIKELQKKDPAKLSRREKKILRENYVRKEDEKYKESEIRFGLRFKILALVLTVLTGTIIATYFISVTSQTEALNKELISKGEIVATSLNNAIRAKFLENFPDKFGSDKKYRKLKSAGDYRDYYQDLDLSGAIFEFVDSQKPINDLVYVLVLGKKKILWGDVHTLKDKQSRRLAFGASKHSVYRKYDFQDQPGIKSYSELYKERGMKRPRAIIQEFESQQFSTKFKKGEIKGWDDPKSKEPGDKESIIDIALPFSLKGVNRIKNMDDVIAEIHIGISKSTAEEQIADTIFSLSLASLIAFVVGVSLSVVAATYLARPIAQMTAGMQQVIQGDFNAAVQLNSGDEIGRLSKVFNRMLDGMSILVSPEVAKVVMNTEDLYNNSEQRDVTVLFSDIRGFTTLSESMTPRQVVEMLNDYLDLMTNIIVKYGGVVDKFVGDEIFSVFGAPYDHPNHPLAACAVALEMGEVLGRHNDDRVAAGKLPIDIGIGINTGTVIAGSMGSKKRVDYTSIGDAVNLGARLEGTNKVYGTLIIMSEFTYNHVKDWVVGRELDSIKVKGKNEPVVIFEVMTLTKEGQELADELLTEVVITDEARAKWEAAPPAPDEASGAETKADAKAQATNNGEATGGAQATNGDAATGGGGTETPHGASDAGATKEQPETVV